jgi:hypothetical protein
MTAPVVFISYSHKDEVWKDKLLPQLRALEQAGVAMKVWEDRQIDAGVTWYPEIQQVMRDAAVAILLISADYLASGFSIKEEVPFLLKRHEQDGMLLIPVLIRACPWKAHRWLADRQMMPRDGKSVANNFPGDQADIVFSEVAEQVFGHIQKLMVQPGTAAMGAHAHAELVSTATLSFERRLRVQHWPILASDRVDLTHLPETGSALFGRDEELRFLDEAWSLDRPSTIRVAAFVAQGGVGKSTLVNRWLDELKGDQFRGATRVFGWSFYSQGARDQVGASADTFMATALRFFGDANPLAGSPWDKGDRLARLVGAERALLVLDGLEPLQSAQAVERGKVRDPAMDRLLRGLARQSEGLCLITTREPLVDLAGRRGYVARDLDQITPQAGRALLRTARVIGTDQELEELAGRFGPHALAVSLLSIYLYEQPGHGVAPAQVLPQLPGKDPVERMLAGYEQWLGETPEHEVLRLLGFFDRPADDGCLDALRCKPVIKGLTDRLAILKQGDWDRVLSRLEQLRLVYLWHGQSGNRFVDAHPLIREYFAKQLCEQNPDAWRAGHQRLYEHLCTHKEGDQPTLDDLQPLYQAVAHGCQAGLQQDACVKVYRARIVRRDEFYSLRKLGAYRSDLWAIAGFFGQLWSRVSPNLEVEAGAWLLNQAAICLRALGRLNESLEPLCVATNINTETQRWGSASSCAINMSEVKLILGDVSDSVADAEQAVTYADHSEEMRNRVSSRTTHANALHQGGYLAEGEMRFNEAEAMQQKLQPNRPMLYSLRGFQYCNLLLAAPESIAWQTMLGLNAQASVLSTVMASCIAVAERTKQTLNWLEIANVDILSIALDHITLSRAALYRSVIGKFDGTSSAKHRRLNEVQLEPKEDTLATAFGELECALYSLCCIGTQHIIPHALLTRAWLWCLTAAQGSGQAVHKNAQADLDEALEIADRGPMRLHMADIHLYRARLFFREEKYPWESPEADLKAAEKLINDCGYHRRDEELEDAKKAILGR